MTYKLSRLIPSTPSNHMQPLLIVDLGEITKTIVLQIRNNICVVHTLSMEVHERLTGSPARQRGHSVTDTPGTWTCIQLPACTYNSETNLIHRRENSWSAKNSGTKHLHSQSCLLSLPPSLSFSFLLSPFPFSYLFLEHRSSRHA